MGKIAQTLEELITKPIPTDRLKPGMRSAENINGTSIKKGKKLTERHINILHEKRRVWLNIYRI